MTPDLESLRARRDELTRLAAEFGLSELRVFGSVARREARPESDVDLLAHVATDRTLLDVVGFESEAEAAFGFPFDVTGDSPRSPFATRIASEALPL